MKVTVYVLTDGPSPSLHRRLMSAELKIDDRGVQLSEIHRHDGHAETVATALRTCLAVYGETEKGELKTEKGKKEGGDE